MSHHRPGSIPTLGLNLPYVGGPATSPRSAELLVDTGDGFRADEVVALRARAS